ncbi:MAG: acylphosphatase [Desulfobacterales bacterium]
MPRDRSRAHVMISGRVQGVIFRDATRRKASGLGVNGWVRNTRDGRVEALFEGSTRDVDEMLRWCRQGSPSARVDNVEVTREEFQGDQDSFSIRY